MDAPETHYAKSGDVNIAYQVVGSGPRDLVYVSGWISNVELAWEEPSLARFLGRLASFSRLIVFDKRGTGLSDRVAFDELPTLEQRMDDVRAVMDAAGSERAALLGISEGGPLCILFATPVPGADDGPDDLRHVRQARVGARLPVGADTRGAPAVLRRHRVPVGGGAGPRLAGPQPQRRPRAG